MNLKDFLTGVILGAAIGYSIAHYRLNKGYQDALLKESNEAREFYRQQYLKKAEEAKVEETETSQRFTDAVKAFGAYQGDTSSSPMHNEKMTDLLKREAEEADAEVAEATAQLQEIEVITSPAVKDSFQEAMSETTSGEGVMGSPEDDFRKPRVISQETYFEAGLDKQYSITWYEGDQVLAGQSGKRMPEETINVTIGKSSLKRFGEQSDDPDTVYIRNLGMQMDFEVVRSHGKYEDEVGPIVEAEATG